MKPGSLSVIVIIALAAVGCSTTRTLAPGEYRLARNEVKVDSKAFPTNELTPYIKQQANSYFIFGWNPFLNIYNWSDGSDKPMSRFFRKIGTAPVVYNSNLVSASEENIKNHLKYLGFYNSTVNAEEIPDGKKMKVLYNVRLGDRIPISEIRYDVPEGGDFEAAFYADTSKVSIKGGTFLSEMALEQESARSAESMRGQGFYGFSKSNYFFVADTLTRPGTAILDYQVKEYTRGSNPDKATPISRYTFGDVSVSINDNLKFSEALVRRLNAINPGQTYNETDVNTTYSRFASLQVFSGVNISTTPTPEKKVDTHISLTPGKLKGFKVNLEGSVTSTGLFGVSPQLNFYHKNLFHGGEWFNIGFTGAFQFKPSEQLRAEEYGVTASLSIPKSILVPATRYKSPTVPRTEFKASYNYQSRPEFTRHIFSASMGYTGRIKNKFLFQLYPLQLSYVRLKDISESFLYTLIENPYLSYSYSDHFDAGIGGTLYYTTNADIVPATSYKYVRFRFDASGNLLSLFKPIMKKNELEESLILGVPFSQYIAGELNLGRTWRFGRNGGQALATRLTLAAGYAYGNSLSLPYEKQFFVGGANSMRGWQARSVGPGFSKKNEYTLLPSQTGDVKIEFDVEHRAHLFWKLESALFAEVGNVWSLPYFYGDFGDLVDPRASFRFNNFYKSLAVDWGVGLRANLGFIILRFDFGMKLHDPSREPSARWLRPGEWFKNDGCAFHFGVGYPF